MSSLRLVPIVEGHGEVQAIRLLLQRIWHELVQAAEHLEVLQPIRLQRTLVNKQSELERALGLARLKLGASCSSGGACAILLLMDADHDLPCEMAPDLLRRAKEAAGDLDVLCVLANVEYETWFVAAAESLHDLLRVEPGEVVENPEEARLGKGWIERRFKGPKYSETIDQPRLTNRMDLDLCRRRSSSFDKLCRELERRAQPHDS